MHEIKFSILIPTHNAAKYLGPVLKSILSQRYGNYEILISDDGSTDITLEVIKSFSDKRIKYWVNQNRVGMTENCKNLIEKSTGKWITILGQDDFLVDNSLSMAYEEITKFKDLDVISSTRSYYNWPDLKSRLRYIHIKSTKETSIEDSNKWLFNIISGREEYFNGPQLYTGSFVSRRLIEKIKKNQSGNFYNYLIPDVSSAISILSNCEKYIKVHQPLFTVGTSSQSTGRKIDNLRDIHFIISQFTTSNELYLMAPRFPDITSMTWYSVEAYIFLKQMRYMPSRKIQDLNQIGYHIIAKTIYDEGIMNYQKILNYLRRDFQIDDCNVRIISLIIKIYCSKVNYYIHKVFEIIGLLISRKLRISSKIIMIGDSQSIDRMIEITT